MEKRLLALIGGATLLSGCGDASKAFEQSFNENFDKSFRSSCVASATKGGAPGAIASSICDCAVAKIDELYSVREKATLSDDKLTPIVNECVTKAVPK